MSEASEGAVDVPVVFEERAAANGKRIGFATLNAPKTLNGLSLEMSRLLAEKFAAWATDPGVAMVMLQGAGEKALCAGGDLHSLYRSMLEYKKTGCQDIRDNQYACEFFGIEYRLDHFIHYYPKPVLCWGHGIVMGGGIGLMANASHRVVTERSKLAFPEINIGLFPDVGGSWLLNRVPLDGGLFLGLTGAPLTAGDAVYAGMADWSLPEAQRASVIDALGMISWSGDGSRAKMQLDELLAQYSLEPIAGPLQLHRERIADLCNHDSLEDIAAAIAAIEDDDAWLQSAKKNLAGGAPSTARLAYELQKRSKGKSLADVLRMELVVALKCAAHGDFAEGIRALLVDKDRQPNWNPATLQEATHEWVEPFFQAPWSTSEHPLADLCDDRTHQSL